MQLILVVIFTIGLLICLSSDSYLGMWVGLEVCNLCVIPWLIGEKSEVTYSAVFKYFVVQVSSSVFIYFGVVIIWGLWGSFYGILLTILGLALKIGGVFSGVLLSFIEGLSWWGVCVTLGVQKIPLVPVFIGFSEAVGNYVAVVFGLALGVCSVWVLSVLSLRSFILLSSVLNIGWILCSMGSSYIVAMCYFTSYLVCFLVVCMIFYIRSSVDYCTAYYSDTKLTVIESTVLLVISGIPPFGMFFINVNIIVELILGNFLLECWFLVILGTFILYMYVNLAVGNLFLGNSYGINNNSKLFLIQCVVLMCSLPVLWCLV